MLWKTMYQIKINDGAISNKYTVHNQINAV